MVLDALELQKGNSFLNIGSGTGYLSCLASCLLGEKGLSHGIEIKSELVKASQAACKTWFESILEMRQAGRSDLPAPCPPPSIVKGNCFDIDVVFSTNSCKYDRIYIGAGVCSI